MIRFDGQVVVVTGAGEGLGASYARLVAARGARVVVNDIGAGVDGHGGSSTPADDVVAQIVGSGGEAVAHHDSIAEPDGASGLVAMALERFGRIDALVNNAGILRSAALGDMELADLDAVIGVHLMGSLYCTRAVLPHMLSRGYGRIVLTSSASGLVGHRLQTAYGAAKAAMVGAMNCLALDCAGTGILINTVVPSATTRMAKGLVADDLARHMSPDHVAALVAYLASDACRRSGDILQGIGGHFARVALIRGPGVQFDPVDPVTPDMVAEAFDRIVDLEGAEPYRGTLSTLAPSLRALGRL